MRFFHFILSSLLDVRAHIPNQLNFGSRPAHTSYSMPSVRAVAASHHRSLHGNAGRARRAARDRLLVMSKIIRSLACTVILACLTASTAHSQDANVVVTQAWSRATPGGSKVAGGYLTIENKGSVADKLLSASTTVAKKVEIHEMAVADGVMTMRPVEGGLPIDAGKIVKCAPGGLHLMIIGLSAPQVQGDKVPMVLKFEKAGEITVSFDVRAMGAPAPGPLSNAAGPTADAVAKM